MSTMTNCPKLPENDGFSACDMIFPNVVLRKKSTSSGSRASIIDSILLVLWYVLTLSPLSSSPAANMRSGKHSSPISGWCALFGDSKERDDLEGELRNETVEFVRRYK